MIIANTEIVAPPITDWGIVVKIDANLGINPAIRKTPAANVNTILLTTRFTVTIPTFWLYVAEGRPPKNALIMLVIPFALIPPDNSLSVASLSSPPIVKEEISPIAWTAFTMYIITIDMIALISNLTPKCIGATIWNQDAFLTASNWTIPKK